MTKLLAVLMLAFMLTSCRFLYNLDLGTDDHRNNCAYDQHEHPDGWDSDYCESTHYSVGGR